MSDFTSRLTGSVLGSDLQESLNETVEEARARMHNRRMDKHYEEVVRIVASWSPEKQELAYSCLRSYASE